MATIIKQDKLRRIAKTVTRVEFCRRALLGLGFAMSGNGTPREIWLDQDGGWEDVAALAILLRSPDIRVMGVATTPGIAEPATAKSRIELLLRDLGEREVKCVDSIPAKADILATGPLTGIARMIRNGMRPKAITWMGGAIEVAGNARGGAEWNATADPRALATVLASSIPLTICPLDLTNQFPSKPEVVMKGGAEVTGRIRTAYAERERYWWDELAAASIAAPGLFDRRQIRLTSDRNGKLLKSPRGHQVTVLDRCKSASFEALLAQSLRF